MVVDLEGHDQLDVDITVLEAIARQTAVTMGTMMTRLRHAKESAVQEERTRIALDLHDTISQSLFGLVYTLQGCIKLLPENPQAIQPELEWALATAQDVRKKIRATIHDMWPTELTAHQFENDLRTYAADVLQAADLEILFDIRGEFNTLSPPVRRGMYRICQESLTNIVHHAGANQSKICVDIADGRARIILRDNGRGFDPATAFTRNFKGEHFGLRGMHERAASLGGTFEIFSNIGAGTSILIDVPANTQSHHE
jgi:signal transduction histidine kinase